MIAYMSVICCIHGMLASLIIVTMFIHQPSMLKSMNRLQRILLKDSPQKTFWEQQTKYNALKNKKQMRWHHLVLRFALNLCQHLHTELYSKECTLADYTHWTTPYSGVQLEFVERYSSMLEDVPCGHRHSALSMDETKIKSEFVFNKSNGTLVGFIDFGSVNHDLYRYGYTLHLTCLQLLG